MSNISEQKLNEILNGIINNYKMKGSISTNALCDILEKYDTSANQIDFVYKSIGEAGIQIVDEDERDRELFEQALSDIGLDDPRQNVPERHRQGAPAFRRRGDSAGAAYAGRRRSGEKAPFRSQPPPGRLHRQTVRGARHALSRPYPGGAISA